MIMAVNVVQGSKSVDNVQYEYICISLEYTHIYKQILKLIVDVSNFKLVIHEHSRYLYLTLNNMIDYKSIYFRKWVYLDTTRDMVLFWYR